MELRHGLHLLGRRPGVARTLRGTLLAVGLAVGTGGDRLALAAAGPPCPDKVYLRTDEALALAFGEQRVERGTAYLGEADRERAAALSGEAFEQGVLHPYRAFDEQGALVGTAYFDNHAVRSKRETLMFVVTPEGKLGRIEVLSFGEPPQYLPPARWYGQLLGLGLTEELSLKGEVKNMAGATLSAQATVGAARRVLAAHQVLAEKEAEEARRRRPVKGPEDGEPPEPQPQPQPEPQPKPEPAPAPQPTPAPRPKPGGGRTPGAAERVGQAASGPRT